MVDCCSIEDYARALEEFEEDISYSQGGRIKQKEGGAVEYSMLKTVE